MLTACLLYTHTVKMVLCNANQLNIKNHHMLKCLERKKNSFNIIVIPLTEPIERISQYDTDNLDFTVDAEVKIQSKHSTQSKTGM
jgi:hypothetical protein